MAFGQIVIGPPGSGKTTFCLGVADFLEGVGRDVAIINLDPANDDLPYKCAANISDLVSLDEVQQQMGLGPNGGLMYCMDYLASNMDWLQEQLAPLVKANHYLIFDCPGQAELHMCHASFHSIVATLTQRWHHSLTAVQLVDSHLCTTPSKFLSALLMCLSSMLHLELPHVNVLSKVDLLAHISEDLDINVDAYTNLSDLRGLLHVDADGSAFGQRFARLSEGLCDVVEDFGLLSLAPLAIQDKGSVANALELIDRANGYAMSGLQGRNPYAGGDEERSGDVKLASSHSIWGADRTDFDR